MGLNGPQWSKFYRYLTGSKEDPDKLLFRHGDVNNTRRLEFDECLELCQACNAIKRLPDNLEKLKKLFQSFDFLKEGGLNKTHFQLFIHTQLGDEIDSDKLFEESD